MSRLKGAYLNCTWCNGRGCLMCDAEREKAKNVRRQPILNVTHEEMQDPSLGLLILDAIGRKAIERAFGPDGGGIDEVEGNCNVVSLVQAMRRATGTEVSPPEQA